MNQELWIAVYAASMVNTEGNAENALADVAEARANEAVRRFEGLGKTTAQPVAAVIPPPSVAPHPYVDEDYAPSRKSPSVAPRHAHR